ncbi:MAG: hypothetical protein WCA19_27120 [Candidatus Acidiferrales bacterium]
MSTETKQQRIAQLEEVLWTLAGRNSLEMYDATHTVGDAIKHCKQQIKSLKTKLARSTQQPNLRMPSALPLSTS